MARARFPSSSPTALGGQACGEIDRQAASQGGGDVGRACGPCTGLVACQRAVDQDLTRLLSALSGLGLSLTRQGLGGDVLEPDLAMSDEAALLVADVDLPQLLALPLVQCHRLDVNPPGGH